MNFSIKKPCFVTSNGIDGLIKEQEFEETFIWSSVWCIQKGTPFIMARLNRKSPFIILLLMPWCMPSIQFSLKIADTMIQSNFNWSSNYF